MPEALERPRHRYQSLPSARKEPAVSESTLALFEVKTCIVCKLTKPVDAFIARRDQPGKYHAKCRPCWNEYNRNRYRADSAVRAKQQALNARWRELNPTFQDEYYQANRESIIANVTAYQKRNPVDPERRRERGRSWYAANRERRLAVKRAWREDNAELVRETQRRAISRRRARLRGLPTEPYTMDQLLERDGTLCALCGEELDLEAVHPEPLAPTVEHLECVSWPDSAGDVPSNCAVAHYRCNCQRGDRPNPAAARKRAELLRLHAERFRCGTRPLVATAGVAPEGRRTAGAGHPYPGAADGPVKVTRSGEPGLAPP
jgi:hypothetical protein